MAGALLWIGLGITVIGAILVLIAVWNLDKNGKPDENGDICLWPQQLLFAGIIVWTLGILLMIFEYKVYYQTSCSISENYVRKPKDAKKTTVARATSRPPTVTQPTFARPPVTSAASF